MWPGWAAGGSGGVGASAGGGPCHVAGLGLSECLAGGLLSLVVRAADGIVPMLACPSISRFSGLQLPSRAQPELVEQDSRNRVGVRILRHLRLPVPGNGPAVQFRSADFPVHIGSARQAPA